MVLLFHRKDCENLIQESRSQQQPTQEAEGLLYWARFVTLDARDISDNYPSQTAGMLGEVSEAEKMLCDVTFYLLVTNAEKAAVYTGYGAKLSRHRTLVLLRQWTSFHNGRVWHADGDC